MRLVLLTLALSTCFCIGESSFSADNSFDYKLIKTVLQSTEDNVVVKTQAYGLGMIQEIFINMEYVTVNRKSFEKACEHYYGTNILKANFSESDVTANNINRYFYLLSNRQITEVVTPDQVKESAMLMINAMYFKGIWKYAFNKMKSTKSDFLKYGTEKVQTDFMVHTDTFKTGKFEKYSVLDLPYENDISMIIVLPEEGVELNEILDPVALKGIIEGEINFIEKEIEVMIPKFELKSKVKLPDILRKMGINTLFNRRYEIYEFSPKGLMISDIIHEAKIVVDEGEMKASAQSIRDSIPLSRSFKSTFNVNRPFVYLVIEKSTKAVLFSGKVVSPL